jgi:GT2 family glycosyltransferase
MPSTPPVSVVIVAWNSGAYLPRCLSALSNQTQRDFEVILVDNHSTDGSVDGLEGQRSNLRLIVERLDSNLGFAPANNIGARLARGKWLALLNADAFPEPNWLENLLRAAEGNPQYAAFASRQIQFHAPHLLDGAGDIYHVSGLAWRDGYRLPAETRASEQREVFSPCAAAALYSREEFLKAGGFDEDYFSYFEDVDLGFRIRLGGGKCLYVPGAVVGHVGSGSTGQRSDFSVYYGYRNLVWTFVKDMPFPLIWLFLPLHVAALFFFIVHLTRRGQGKIIRRAVFDALRGLPRAVRKRTLIQRDKKVKTGELLKVMSTGLLEPYREFVQRNRMK